MERAARLEFSRSREQTRESGIDVTASLITVTQHSPHSSLIWRINYDPKEYVGRRGGDFIVEVDAFDASIKEVLRGQ